MAVSVNAGPVLNQDVKILIVDDETRNLDALEVMLEPTGCSLVRASSADEALLAMLRHEFAAMILDIRMPGISGIELANLVKQRRRTQNVPILFLTAHLVEDEDILRGYGVGAVDYLSKPVKADILRSKINVFIELYRKTRALALLNEELQRQIDARQKAQEALQQINQELELRVAERTAALTIAQRPGDLVDGSRGVVRVPARLVRRASTHLQLPASRRSRARRGSRSTSVAAGRDLRV
jgi:DNA-binding response OmpR family regulator